MKWPLSQYRRRTTCQSTHVNACTVHVNAGCVCIPYWCILNVQSWCPMFFKIPSYLTGLQFSESAMCVDLIRRKFMHQSSPVWWLPDVVGLHCSRPWAVLARPGGSSSPSTSGELYIVGGCYWQYYRDVLNMDFLHFSCYNAIEHTWFGGSLYEFCILICILVWWKFPSCYFSLLVLFFSLFFRCAFLVLHHQQVPDSQIHS